MRRRELITLVGGAAVLWPLGAVHAQQAAMPVIGFLNAGSYAPRAKLVAAFHAGMAEIGYVEKSNVIIEYRWAEDQSDRLRVMGAELVNLKVSAIAAPGGIPAPMILKGLTNSIPIIFSVGEDPAKLGLVASLNRPGGNITGVSYFTQELGPKRIELLHDLIPGVTRIAMLTNLKGSNTERAIGEIKAGAAAMGVQIDVHHAANDRDIDTALMSIQNDSIRALLVHPDPFFTSHASQIASLCLSHKIPSIFSSREFIDVGGLMSYGVSLRDVYRQVGVYTARILKGEKPADLPVIQPIKFELVINLKTAKALGLEIPPMLLTRADEVIE